MRVSQQPASAFDRRFGQSACFAGAIAVLLSGFGAVSRFAENQFDILIGLLAVSAVAISTVTLGVVMSCLPADVDR